MFFVFLKCIYIIINFLLKSKKSILLNNNLTTANTNIETNATNIENIQFSATVTAPDPVSTASGQWTRIMSFSVPAGICIIIYGGAFDAISTSVDTIRQLYISTSSSHSDGNFGRYAISHLAAFGVQEKFAHTTIQHFSDTGFTTAYLYARQNSGSTLKFYPYVRVLHLSK